MPSEESAAQTKKQWGLQLKILTLDQILSRLPNTLAGNNSQKQKNEIRQLLYSLYHSKKLTKTIYNNFINIILKWKPSLLTLKIAKLMNLTDLDNR